jgi:hypothetical protein
LLHSAVLVPRLSELGICTCDRLLNVPDKVRLVSQLCLVLVFFFFLRNSFAQQINNTNQISRSRFNERVLW